uniref:Uncharacterized protein n=1 Tax=Cyclopterus lumpus TaxID=8103 RepID=A0A8C3ACH1_CYCLU
MPRTQDKKKAWSLSARVGEAETRVEQVEDWAMEATGALCTCLEQKRPLQRSNIHIVKVPEKAEGQDIIGFVQQLILHRFGQEHFPHPPVIERAHRSPTQRNDSTSSTNPRPMLVRFLSFQDKVKILHLSRQKGELLINKTKIHFYPDYSAELVKQRGEFEPIKRKLWDMNMDYSLSLCPSRQLWRRKASIP